MELNNDISMAQLCGSALTAVSWDHAGHQSSRESPSLADITRHDSAMTTARDPTATTSEATTDDLL
jgi:hypothetical protein